MTPEEILAIYEASVAEHKAKRKDAEDAWTIISIILGADRAFEVKDQIVLDFAKRWYNDCVKEMTNPREPLEETVANMQAALRVISWHMPHHDYVTYTKTLMEQEHD